MWKAQAGVKVSAPATQDDDDWETDADFVVCTHVLPTNIKDCSTTMISNGSLSATLR